MSRSYRKISKGKKYYPQRSFNKALNDEDFTISNWPSVRMKEGKAIHDELVNPEYGEAIFPNYHGLDRSRCFSILRWHPLYFKFIREWYFEEIRNILNGYSDDKRNWAKLFLNDFYGIKSGTLCNDKKSIFEWLNFKQVRKAIKNWTGDPFDILKYLSDNRLIEQAVSSKFKKINSK